MKTKPTKIERSVSINKRLMRRVSKMNGQQEISVGGNTVVLQNLFDNITKFKEHFDEVEKHFVERANELEQIKYAMLIKEHVLFKGKPGTAKSKLSRYSFGYITDADTFSIQLSKFMSEEYLFGAIDINKMRNEGKVEHITAKSIVDAEFAFIDEVFDGNDALLRSLLEVLNERTWTRHHQKLVAKLHTAILTSNYVREDEATEAFLDRIMFKSDVRPISSNKNRLSMYKTYIKHGDRGHHHLASKLNGKAVSYKELCLIADYILGDSIELPEAIIKLYDMIIREYSKQLNCYVSDRKANKMLNIIKASALLNSRTKATFDDIAPIRYALVILNNDQQEEVFRAVYTKLMSDNVKYEQVVTELDNLTSIANTLQQSFSQKLNPKSKEILELNEEAQLFEQKLLAHDFHTNGGSGFKDVDIKFNEIRQDTDKVLREIAKTLKLTGK